MEKHDQAIRTTIVKTYLDRCFWPFGGEQIENMTVLFKLLQQPHYFRIIERSSNFRAVVIAKIRDLIEGLINLRENVELGVRLKLASELKKLRNKIDTSGPYTDKKFDHVPSLSFN